MLNYRKYNNFEDLVFHTYISFFSRFPSNKELKMFVESLKKKKIDINTFFNVFFDSEEKKTKPFVSCFSHKKLTDQPSMKSFYSLAQELSAIFTLSDSNVTQHNIKKILFRIK